MKTLITKYTVMIILMASVYLVSCSVEEDKEEPAQPPISVNIKTPSKQLLERITVSGQIESQETAFISTRLMGFISSVRVQPGDRVQKGQLLVTINNGDILAKHAQAEAMIAEAEAALADAKRDYERFEALYKQQSATTKEFENAALRYQTVKAKAEAALQMKYETNAMLAYTTLVAPFDGVITQKNNQEGSMANPGMPILTMEKSDGYQVNASVSEDEIGKLKIGMSADVVIKSTGKQLTGVITEISPSSQFTGGEFQIKIKIKIPSTEKSDLFSGMYTTVDIKGEKRSGAQSLFVPASALIQKDQLVGLYMMSNDWTAQLRWLKVGRRYGDQVEILSGLTSEEMFISHSDGRLYDGAPVSVKW